MLGDQKVDGLVKTSFADYNFDELVFYVHAMCTYARMMFFILIFKEQFANFSTFWSSNISSYMEIVLNLQRFPLNMNMPSMTLCDNE